MTSGPGFSQPRPEDCINRGAPISFASRLKLQVGTPAAVGRKLAALAILAAGVAVLALSIRSTGNAAHKDFISYWAAGQLLLSHANPYDEAAVFRLEQSVGFSERRPLVMRNPPFALILAIPLGLFGPNLGVVLWSLLIVASLMASVRILWSMHGRPPDQLHLFGYAFAPALACMALGQTSTFALLGLTGFLSLHRERPFWAGVCLTLLAIKPHVLLPFGLALLIWVVSRRGYAVLAGVAAGMAAAVALPLCWHPSLWADYAPTLQSAATDSEFIPTVSAVFRTAISRNSAWIQLVPAGIGCGWAIWYFVRRRSRWEWREDGLLLLPVSLFVAPYSWFTDEILVLPAILAALYSRAERGRSIIDFALLDGIALALVILGVRLSSGAYLWTTTAWLGWYLYAKRQVAG